MTRYPYVILGRTRQQYAQGIERAEIPIRALARERHNLRVGMNVGRADYRRAGKVPVNRSQYLRYLREPNFRPRGEERGVNHTQSVSPGVQPAQRGKRKFLEISPMILRHAYSIVEDAKRAMAGQSKQVADAIREETESKIKELIERSASPTEPCRNTNSPTR